MMIFNSKAKYQPKARRQGLLSFARPLLGFAGGERGSIAAEFGLILPVLSIMLFSIIKMGIAMNNFIEITDGVRAGARQFAVSRTDATPWTDGTNMFYNSTSNLTKASITLTVAVNGTPCSTDGSCQTALAAGQGTGVSVSASYPCDLVIVGIDLAPNCTVSSQTTERVE